MPHRKERILLSRTRVSFAYSVSFIQPCAVISLVHRNGYRERRVSWCPQTRDAGDSFARVFREVSRWMKADSFARSFARARTRAHTGSQRMARRANLRSVPLNLADARDVAASYKYAERRREARRGGARCARRSPALRSVALGCIRACFLRKNSVAAVVVLAAAVAAALAGATSWRHASALRVALRKKRAAGWLANSIRWSVSPRRATLCCVARRCIVRDVHSHRKWVKRSHAMSCWTFRKDSPQSSDDRFLSNLFISIAPIYILFSSFVSRTDPR